MADSLMGRKSLKKSKGKAFIGIVKKSAYKNQLYFYIWDMNNLKMNIREQFHS